MADIPRHYMKRKLHHVLNGVQQVVEERKQHLLYHPEVETGSNDEVSDMDQTVKKRVLTTVEVHAPAAFGCDEHPPSARATQREYPQIMESSHPQLKELEKSPIT